MLEIQNLSAGYGGKSVLSQLTLTVPEGRVTVLLGPNGCGKSTLLKTVAGILSPQEGTLRWEGDSLSALPQKQRARRVAYLAQGGQIPDITVERLVLHGRFPYLGYPRRYARQDLEIARQAMEEMGLAELARRPMAQLSGGQRQKAYIAMALAQNAQLLLLDEPATYLDISHQLQLLTQAKNLCRQGKTVLMVAHDLPAALSVADHVLLMKDGRLMFQGTPEDAWRSGQLEQAFGICLERLETSRGPRYICHEAACCDAQKMPKI